MSCYKGVQVTVELPRDVAVRVEMLPATNGDCLFVSTQIGRRPFRILIDSGATNATYNAIIERLSAIPMENGARQLDLLVVSHLDSDHIGNVARVLTESRVHLRIADIWFNGWNVVSRYSDGRRSLVASITEADEVSAAIDQLELPYNEAFDGEAAMVTGGRTWMPVPMPVEAPAITLLGPRSEQMTSLAREWDQAAERLAARSEDISEVPSLSAAAAARPPLQPPARMNVPALAATSPGTDTSAPNASSIAFVIEANGARLVLAGDSHEGVYDIALLDWLAAQPYGQRSVDLIKLAHHGSKNNTHARLVTAGALHYLVSTNGSRHRHPDDETLARLVTGNEQKPTFWFNYDNEHVRRWTNAPPRWRPECHYGDAGHFVIDVPR